MKTFLSKEELMNRTDEQLVELWQRLAGVFSEKNSVKVNQPVVAGFLQLSRETDRRGLELSQTKFGKIILQPKIKAI